MEDKGVDCQVGQEIGEEGEEGVEAEREVDGDGLERGAKPSHPRRYAVNRILLYISRLLVMPLISEYHMHR